MDAGDPGEKRILLACMPKSGSTFLSAMLAELPGMRRERLVPAYERREQELCAQRLVQAEHTTEALRQIWRQKKLPGEGRPIGYVAQHHVRNSAATGALIVRHDLLPVVLVRDIFDVVPSIHDHLTNAALFMSMAHVTEEFRAFEPGRAHAFIADLVIPWYFNFYVGWRADPRALMLTYEELRTDPAATIGRIHDHFGRRVGAEAVQRAVARGGAGETRRNKGVAGRGEALSEAVRDRIRSYAAFYPGVDFSPIGL